MKRETIFDLGVFCLLVAVSVLTRWVAGEFEALSNFTAIGAAALFAGFYFRGKWTAALVPLAVMVISNFALAKYNHWQEMAIVYVAWIVPVVLGIALKGRENVWRIGGCAVASSVWFYLFTNFAYWYWDRYDLYPQSAAGLIQGYIAAIPFFRNMLAGDLLFAGLIFGTYRLANAVGLLSPKSEAAPVRVTSK